MNNLKATFVIFLLSLFTHAHADNLNDRLHELFEMSDMLECRSSDTCIRYRTGYLVNRPSGMPDGFTLIFDGGMADYDPPTMAELEKYSRDLMIEWNELVELDDLLNTEE